jgi:hypothetical protein
MKMKFNVPRSFILVFILVFFTACAAHVVTIDTATAGDPAGFWRGLWHGFILLFTFIVSLFKDDVAVYAAHNVGGLYDLGFLLGVMIFFGGSGNRSRSKCC